MVLLTALAAALLFCGGDFFPGMSYCLFKVLSHISPILFGGAIGRLKNLLIEWGFYWLRRKGGH